MKTFTALAVSVIGAGLIANHFASHAAEGLRDRLQQRAEQIEQLIRHH